MTNLDLFGGAIAKDRPVEKVAKTTPILPTISAEHHVKSVPYTVVKESENLTWILNEN